MIFLKHLLALRTIHSQKPPHHGALAYKDMKYRLKFYS